MPFEFEQNILPEFPRTEHLPYRPNASKDDRVSSERDAQIILGNERVVIEEKVDAANSGMCLYDGQPIIRNRNHVLRKNYGGKNTPAKKQFTAIWGWFYDNLSKFEAINKALGWEAAVYGEWMYYQHTIFYDKLPAYFVPYDIWDWEKKLFLPTPTTGVLLTQAGFRMPPLLHDTGSGTLKGYADLDRFMGRSAWAAAPELQSRPENADREGLYIKVYDDKQVTRRFKMVRQGYRPGESFGEKRNKLEKVSKT